MQNVGELIQQYGMLAIFISVLVESIGLPIPCYPVLMVAAAANTSPEHLTGMLIVGSVACLLADIGWYIAGYRVGFKIVGLLCKISLSPDSCARSTGTMFARFGMAALVPTKFLPGVSTIAVVLAGATKVRLRTFFFFETLGSIVYVGAAIVLGMIFRNAISEFLAGLDKWGRWGITVVGVALALFVSWKWFERQRFIRQLRMDRVTVNELRRMMDGGQDPVILDVRTQESRLLLGTIPGSVHVDMMKLETVKEKVSSEREVVIYCACPNEASAAIVAKELKKSGFKKIRPLLGGIEAWAQAGYVVETLVA